MKNGQRIRKSVVSIGLLIAIGQCLLLRRVVADDKEEDTTQQTCSSGGSGNGEGRSCSSSNTRTQEQQQEPWLDEYKRRNIDNPCRVYLAKSTIENAGMGVFTAVDLKEGEQLLYGDMIVPCFNQCPFMDHPIDKEAFPSCVDSLDGWIWNDYTWTSSALLSSETPGEVDSHLLGYSSTCNSFFDERMNNLESERDDTKYDTAELRISRDPGVGAFSPYYDQRHFARIDIAAGSELFVEYGEHYFDHRKYGNEMVDDIETARAKTIRSVDWLENNGRCLDNLRPDKSTIPQAGRGAFATRFLPKGSIITPMPLIHISNKTDLMKYHYEDDDTGKSELIEIGYEIMLNYVFGHSQSTMVLSPYHSLYINHKSDSPNARIQWSETKGGFSSNHNSEWLEKSVGELEKLHYVGLSFDIVAARDIEPGEEVVINYGKEWEDSWKDHVENWSIPEECKHNKNCDYDNEVSDIFVEKPFRHEIMIPDDMFPNAWRNNR